MHFPLDTSQWPAWVIPAMGGGIALVILALGFWLFRGKKESPGSPRWHQTPMLRTFERQGRREGGGDGRDKRQSLRRTGQYVDVLLSDAEAATPPRPAMVIDRSMRGLCIATEIGYDVDNILSVRPTSAPSSVPWVRIYVKNCRNVGNGWEIGCEFVQSPPASILMLFG